MKNKILICSILVVILTIPVLSTVQSQKTLKNIEKQTFFDVNNISECKSTHYYDIFLVYSIAPDQYHPRTHTHIKFIIGALYIINEDGEKVLQERIFFGSWHLWNKKIVDGTPPIIICDYWL